MAGAWLSSKVGLRRSSWVRDESYLRRHVLPFFGERAVGSITRQEVTEWVSALGASELAAQTVRQCYRILSQVMAEAVESHLIVSSPCRKVALPRVSSSSPALFLTPSEVSRLAAAIEPRFRCLVLVAAYLGLRWGEVAGLLVSAVDLLGAPGGAACERSSQLKSGATGGPSAEGGGAGGSECCGDGALGGAACERSSLLKGGASGGPSAEGGATGGSDSFGAGGGGSAGVLRVVGALEEVAGCVRYVTEVKSRGGRRSLTLPPFLVLEFRRHLELHGSSPSLIPSLVDAPSLPGGSVPSSSFVFTDVDGSVLRGAKFRRRFWKPAVARAGLPSHLRFHDLRHTCASLLIAQGAHPKEIQARLGHSSIRTTMDIYGHLLPNLGARLDEGLERMWQGVKTDE